MYYKGLRDGITSEKRPFKLALAILFISLIVPFLFIMLHPLQAFSALDDTQLRLLEQFEIPLRWDNIEDEEPWLGGIRPVYNANYGFHTVKLGCKDHVLVKLYKDRLLRIYNPEGPFKDDGLRIALSNGSGLYITYPYSIDHERRSILLTPPQRLPYLVRIENVCEGNGSTEIGLFYSRYEYINDIAPYRSLIPLPLEKVNITRDDKLPSEVFYLLTPYNPVSVGIKGDATFSIESRFLYNPYDPERLQPYHIQVRIDGRIFKNIGHESLPHTTTHVYVNGREQIIGRTQRDFMNIPEGKHRMVIESDAMLYIRILRRDEPDYIFTINEPRISPEEIRRAGSPPVLRKSPWGADEYNLTKLLEINPSLSLYEFLAYGLIKDNIPHEGDIIGTMLFREATRNIPHASDIARSYYLSHTFYRDILPENAYPLASKGLYYFITPSLRDITQPHKSLLYPEHLEDAVRLLPSSIFTELLNDKSNPLIYHLPDRPSPTFLRIIISKQGFDKDTLLKVQMDDMPPLEARIYRDENLSEKDFIHSQGEELIRILSSLPYSAEPPTLAGRFSSLRPPSLIINTAYLEIPLSERVKVIRLWREGMGRPMVSIQYRTSRDNRLPQTAYMRYIKSIPLASRLLIDLLRDGENAIKQLKKKQDWGFPYVYTVRSGDTLEGIFKRVMGLRPGEIYNEYIKRFRMINPHIGDINHLRPKERILLPMRFLRIQEIVKIEILNDLIPLYRLIHTRAKGFMATLGKETLSINHRKGLDLNRHIMAANDLYKRGKYINALEALQPLIYQTGGVDRERLLLLQADVLKALAEYFLMENTLKGLFVYSGHEAIRKEAFQRLSSYYVETGDTDALMGLYSTYLIRTPEIKIIPEFIKLLIEEGEYEMALKTGLLLPEEQQPLKFLLRACLVESWWQAFDLFIKRIKSPEEKALWMAKRKLKEGKYREAIELFKKAGVYGRDWYKSMIEADSIYKGLRNAEDKNIYALIKRWQRWQEKHPGPFRWRSAENLLMDSSGALILYNRSRDMYHRMFVSRHDKTVKLRVYGPVRLRIEVRPLFEAKPTRAYNGWIEMTDNGRISHYPVIDNLTSITFDVTGRKHLKAGQKVVLLYDVKEGLHNIEIYSEDKPLLIGLYKAVPEISIPVLPEINTDSILAITGGGFRGLVRSIINEVSSSSFMKAEGSTPYSPKDGGDRKIIQKMINLLWEAEHHPETFNNNLAMAERIFVNNHHISQLRPLIYRFYRKTRFVPVEDILSSGGIRMVRVIGESPSTPEMRVRASMIPPLLPGEQLLYGYERVILQMKNLRDKDIEAEIKSEGIAYLPLEPVEIFFEIDGERVRKITVGEDNRKSVRLHLKVSRGEHYVKIGISRPVADQFIRVKLWEKMNGKGIPLIKTFERRYHLATPEEPVIMVVEGPLMLYVEKRVGNESIMDYMPVDKGIHRLEFHPDREKEALYRFYKREPYPQKPSTPRRQFVVDYREAETPAVRIKEFVIPNRVEFDDRISLGSQEDGTWSITGAFVRRRQTEAEEMMEEFIELSLSHRFFNEFSRYNSRYEILGRIRRHGGPTLGVSGHLACSPVQTPYNYNLNGAFYIQRPEVGGEYEYSLYLDASIVDKREIGPKIYHTPSLAGYFRYMSMKDYNGYHIDDVDQDIFTTYRTEHRYGLRIADKIFYRPWLDSILTLYGKVTLNEDLNPLRPDNMGFDIRWKQLIRATQTTLYYQETHYLPDNDRDEYTITRRLGLGASIEKWLDLNRRIEAGFRLIWHLNVDEFSGRLYLTIHLGKARGYRDFRYGEMAFPVIRQMHISYEEDNNHIIR